MLPEPFANAVILTGPTGSGKTSLGIELALRLGAEIVSMDSMALYRGMDVGTAKPTAEQRQRVPHHLIDVLDPWESASVAWWLEQAAKHCQDITRRGKRVLFVGGTPLYLKALLRGLFDGPAADEQIRGRLTQEAGVHGSQMLHERLARVDPRTADRVHPNDLRRIIRALEVLEITGQPISAWQQQWGREAEVRSQESGIRGQESEIEAYWLDLPRSELYARINQRVQDMFAGGFVEEVRHLREVPQRLSREARQALGYKDVLAHLDGNACLEDTILQVQIGSRHFAKRQISWFRHLAEVRPLTRELTRTLWGLTIR